MSKHVLFYGWNRPIPGREKLSAVLFQEFNQFLERTQQSGVIDSFENVFLTTHGGDLNGFTLARGDMEKLHELMRDEEFNDLITRAGLIMDGGGLITGATGEGVMEWMARWMKFIPD